MERFPSAASMRRKLAIPVGVTVDVSIRARGLSQSRTQITTGTLGTGWPEGSTTRTCRSTAGFMSRCSGPSIGPIHSNHPS